MIFVYQFNPMLTVKCTVCYYKSLDALFRIYREWQLANFTNQDWADFNLSEALRMSKTGYVYDSGLKSAYDHNGVLLRSDYLVGQYREWLASRKRSCKSYCRSGKAYGHYRAICTFQERAHYYIDPEAKEMCVNVKMRNSRGNNLPTSWDDIYSWNQKCWKKQSKRQHQWKTD